MNMTEIKKHADEVSDQCEEDLLHTYHIKLLYDEQMNKYKMDSMLKTWASYSIIFMKTNLDEAYEKFLFYHELGHFLLHYDKDMKYSFYLSRYKNRLEMEANTFACLCLLGNEQYEEINIIEVLKNKGVPDKIAEQFFDRMHNEAVILPIIKDI